MPPEVGHWWIVICGLSNTLGGGNHRIRVAGNVWMGAILNLQECGVSVERWTEVGSVAATSKERPGPTCDSQSQWDHAPGQWTTSCTLNHEGNSWCRNGQQEVCVLRLRLGQLFWQVRLQFIRSCSQRWSQGQPGLPPSSINVIIFQSLLYSAKVPRPCLSSELTGWAQCKFKINQSVAPHLMYLLVRFFYLKGHKSKYFVAVRAKSHQSQRLPWHILVAGWDQ